MITGIDVIMTRSKKYIFRCDVGIKVVSHKDFKSSCFVRGNFVDGKGAVTALLVVLVKRNKSFSHYVEI